MKKTTTSKVALPFLMATLATFILGGILVLVPYIIVIAIVSIIIFLAAAVVAALWNTLVSLFD
jgi:uncharacterized membrane protein